MAEKGFILSGIKGMFTRLINYSIPRRLPCGQPCPIAHLIWCGCAPKACQPSRTAGKGWPHSGVASVTPHSCVPEGTPEVVEPRVVAWLGAHLGYLIHGLLSSQLIPNTALFSPTSLREHSISGLHGERDPATCILHHNLPLTANGFTSWFTRRRLLPSMVHFLST